MAKETQRRTWTPKPATSADWRASLQGHLRDEGEFEALLGRWCEYLEAKMKPYVTPKKTSFIAEFQGKKAYLKSYPERADEYAIEALQALYLMEGAWASGDITKAIQATMMFDSSLENFRHYEQSGHSRDQAAFSSERSLEFLESLLEVKASQDKIRDEALDTANKKKKLKWEPLRDEANERMKVIVPNAKSVRDASMAVHESFSHLENPPKPDTIARWYRESLAKCGPC